MTSKSSRALEVMKPHGIDNLLHVTRKPDNPDSNDDDKKWPSTKIAVSHYSVQLSLFLFSVGTGVPTNLNSFTKRISHAIDLIKKH